MASATAGVVGYADTNQMAGPPSAGKFSTPATWTYIWFSLAVLFLVAVYFGSGGLRGGVVS